MISYSWKALSSPDLNFSRTQDFFGLLDITSEYCDPFY